MDKKQFEEEVNKKASVIFCVKCGSTAVDQNSINELRCYTCDNISVWDGTKFGIVRFGSGIKGDYYLPTR